MTNNKEKKLLISFDPGYDSYKVVINGKLIQVPYCIENVEGIRSLSLASSSHSSDYIKYVKEFKQYIVGSAAKAYESHKNMTEVDKKKIQEDEQNRYNSDRFIASEFVIGFESVLGYSMLEYVKQEKDITIEELMTYEIYLMLEYPQAVVESFGKKSAIALAITHEFDLFVGNMTTPVHFKFEIEKKNIYYVAQVLCAVYNEMFNDKGLPVKNVEKRFPTLVMDGGYGTFVTSIIRKGFEIFPAETISTSEFAMMSVHKKASKKIFEKYKKDVKFYELAHKLMENDTMLKGKTESGEWTSFDAKTIVDECLDETCSEIIDLLNKKYNELSDCKSAIIAGGTGAAYYDALKEEYVGKGKVFSTDDENTLYLSNTNFNGENVNPVFVIAIGGYKLLQYYCQMN